MAKYDLIIINRSFWPIYPVIGESLLQLAEGLSLEKKVGVIFQDHSKFRKKLKSADRANKVNFFPIWAGSNSSSNILVRILDSIFFMFSVIICLIITRPKNIYISTDPPVLVPFVVSYYSKIFKSKFIYHIQDIHPEASNVVLRMNSILFKLIKKIDSYTMRKANTLITLTKEMKSQILNRSNTTSKIMVIDNPSIPFKRNLNYKKKIKGFSFTGNLGRLQRIPFLIDAIKNYLEKGGNLKFSFAGGGIFSKNLEDLSKLYKQIEYRGIISAKESAELSSNYEWALLPIDDEITKYAFPSKSSSYVFSGAKILAICDENTNVSKWVRDHKLGITVKPNISILVEKFFKIENNEIDISFIDVDRVNLKKVLSIDVFIQKLSLAIYPNLVSKNE